MPKQKMNFDRTEIVVLDTHLKNAKAYNLPYDKVISIRFEKVKVRKLFKTVDAEKIVLTTRVRPDPIYYLSTEEGSNFEGYKQGLMKFAKDNRISFQNDLEDAEQK